MAKRNPRAGSNFDDFLKADGIYEDVQNAAIKKVLSAKLEAAMLDQKTSLFVATASCPQHGLFTYSPERVIEYGDPDDWQKGHDLTANSTKTQALY